MWKIKILSPAKINLHLDISPPGANGFHPLRSLFVMVSLYDEMRIEEKDEGCVIISDLSVHEKENILYKTWLLCQKEGLYKKGLKIHLKKKIPHGAGLGGGSGNAASLLRVLYGLNPQIKPFSYWKNLASDLGSDVPFFMDTTAAVVSGRGEVIKAVESLKNYSVLIVFPGIPFSTPKAFSSLDHFRKFKKDYTWRLTLEQIENSFLKDNPKNWPFFNSFSPSAYESYPPLKLIEETLLTNGADFAILSGSGSAMVGIFTSKDICLRAKRVLINDFPATYAVDPLDIIPCGIVI
jgi:4-diphosphocytidyl-2-C-methyl-D-erythritol kinase